MRGLERPRWRSFQEGGHPTEEGLGLERVLALEQEQEVLEPVQRQVEQVLVRVLACLRSVLPS